MDFQGHPSKILALIDLLEGGADKPTIAVTLGVSPRTADRYLKSLREDWQCDISVTAGRYTLLTKGAFG